MSANIIKKTYWYFREKTRDLLRHTVVDPMKSCTVRGHKINIGLSNPLEGYRISTYSTKEPETLDWLEKSLQPGDVFYDIGANIGLYSIYAGLVQPQCTVYAFEPSALNFTRLFRNVMNNRLSNVIPLNIPIAGSTKVDYFHMSDWQDGSAFHSFGETCETSLPHNPNKNKYGIPLRYGIMGTTLDDLVYTYGLPHPTLIKLDVDSIEEQILAAGQKVLQSPKCRSILVEIMAKKNDSETTIEQILRKQGFDRSLVSDWAIPFGDGLARNFIFQKK